MAEQSGKSRSLRIVLDYYKQHDWLYWSRWIFAGVALVLAGGYTLLVMLGTSASESSTGESNWLQSWVQHVNTGPVSKAHSHFEQNCHQCHPNDWLNNAIASDAGFVDSQASQQHISAACNKCHSIYSHFAQANAASTAIDKNCVTCHSEHNGRDVNLADVRSKSCTQCHSNLKEFAAASKLNTVVSDFSLASHSPSGAPGGFRSLVEDKGRIKFDHAQHLLTGQVDGNSKGGFQKDMLPTRWRSAYKTVGEFVQLDCSSCHRLRSPSGDVSSGSIENSPTATDRELSHFYAPVEFEKHCAACHQLTFVGQTNDMLPMPHAAPREETTRILAAKIVGGRISGQIQMASSDSNNAMANASIASINEAELRVAVEAVYSRCEKCHLKEDLSDQQIKAWASNEVSSEMIPQRWLQYGLFDHGAHEKISNCKFCHDETKIVSPDGKPTDHQLVMIKGAESCVPCHRDSSVTPELNLDAPGAQETYLGQGQQPTIASAECTLCHRYHWHRQPTNAINDAEAAGGKE